MSMKIGIRAWIDFAFKKIFGKPGNEICFISLVNSVLNLPAPVVSVEFENPFMLQEFEEDKLVCVDVKATDQKGRIFVVEVQIVVQDSFAQRALYYTCKGYSEQLGASDDYGTLKATYTICLMVRQLWDDDQLHHCFRLVEQTSGKTMEDSIEIHTVELSKYNGVRGTVSDVSPLERWCYWLKYSSEHSEDELRALLPDLAFQRATSELVAIQQITEERTMYDTREKATRDYESSLIGAERKGKIEGRIEGEIKLIRTLESLIGFPPSDESALAKQSLEELQARSELLQAEARKGIRG